MMKWCLLFTLCIAFVVHADIYADLYALRLNGGQLESLVGIEFDSGYKAIVDLTPLNQNFTTLHNVTFYDANAETFIIGNANPPMLALINTFNKQIKVVELPLYGQLLALTSYDGTVYVLLGLDEDVPTLGSIVAYDLTSGDNSRLSKFKIDPTTSFLPGSTLTWLPHMQIWLFELMNTTGSTLNMVNTDPTKAIYYSLNLPGGWQSTYFDVNTDNRTVLAYKDGTVSKIDLMTYQMSNLTSFDCSTGSAAVNFQKKQVYQISNCDSLVISSYSWFYNKTMPPMDLDPALSDATSIQSVGTYIPYLCGAPCGTHPDCALSKTCATCRDGKCSPMGACNSFCQTPDDCYAGVCVGNCENNRCGKRGCGMKCENHDECMANSQTCQVCRLGECVDFGDCGAYCITPLHCYAGACVGNCHNWRCATSTLPSE